MLLTLNITQKTHGKHLQPHCQDEKFGDKEEEVLSTPLLVDLDVGGAT